MTVSRSLSLPAHLLAQAQVVFNDNAAKFMLAGLIQFPGVLAPETVPVMVSVIAMLLVLPFVLFSPIAGWLSDHYSKWSVLNFSFWLQLGVMGLLLIALHLRSVEGAMFGFFLLAVQSTIFAPAKRGILKELVGSQKLSFAVGWMEMLSVGSILGGAYAGGHFFDHYTQVAGGDPWIGTFKLSLILTVASAVALGVFQGVKHTPAFSQEPYHTSLWWQHFRQVAELWRNRSVFRAAMGVVYFYTLGGFVYLTVMQVGREIYGGDVGSASTSGNLFGLLGIGTILGNLSAGFISRRGIELGLVPVGAAIIAASLGVLGISAPTSLIFQGALLILGFGAGLYLVPLFAFVQDNADETKRGDVLAGVGLLDSLGGLFAAVLQGVLAQELGLNSSTQFLFMVFPAVGVFAYALWKEPDSILRIKARLLVGLIYRVRVKGIEHVPAKGGALVICNHVSYIDAVILQIAFPRKLRFLAFAGFARYWWMNQFFRLAGIIPVSPQKATEGIRQATKAMSEGDIVCIFPEGQISRTGELMQLKRGFELIAKKANVPVIPVFLDRMWGSIFSFSGRRFFWKRPQRIPYPVFVNIGQPMLPEKISAISARQALLDLGAESFEDRPELKQHVARECVRALARHPRRVALVDRTVGRREMKAGVLLATAAALSRRIRKTVSAQRVGIVLTPGIGATIANLAVMLAGKVPVNLNFTAGRAALEASFRIAGVDTIISADVLKQKLPNFPWLERTLDLKTEIEQCGKPAILRWLAAGWILPGSWIASFLGVPCRGDRAEAGLLFTSGSSGEPKGVPLTHRNILGNSAQISATGILPEDETLLGCLPIFHSFGFTVTLWYPLLTGLKVVALPSPLETRKVVEAIAAEKVTIFVGTPTFLRPFLKKAERAELQSLKFVISGAERMPLDLYEAFRDQLGVQILQGYGLTETSPVTNVNLPDPPVTTSTAEPQTGHRLGSVGRLLPGMTARIVDPETGEGRPLSDIGMLYLRGPNVFSGYLNDEEKTRAAFRDGWFVTGDLGRFDDDGFLFIEGRLSRFSKIGGEMVPHGTVEQKIIEVFQLEQAEGPAAIVVGVPDAAKGEALVLLTTLDITVEGLRERLSEAGLPNLWIPKVVRRVEKLPLLGSGKCDLKGCRELALKGMDTKISA